MVPFYEYKTKLIHCFSGNCFDYPPHLHGGPELLRVRSGELKVLIHTQEYLVSAGEIAIIFPNVVHSYQTITQSQDTKLDLLVCGQDENNGFPHTLIGSSLAEPVKPISYFHPDVDYIFSASLKEENEGRDTHILHAYLQIFWRRLLPQLTITDSVQPAAADLTTNLIAYITEHFREPLSLELLSRELGVCRFYLSRIFTQVLHIGFYDYVNALRTNYAKKLLLDSKDTVIDIAMQCGFQSQQTFNRVFKKNCGMTPAAYRRMKSGKG